MRCFVIVVGSSRAAFAYRAAIVGWVVACGSTGGTDGSSPSGTGGAPAFPLGSGGSDFCIDGSICSCPDGSQGKTSCLAFPPCVCNKCEPFTPDPLPAFDACGGDATGTYRATSISAQGAVLRTDAYPDCIGHVAQPPGAKNLLLDLQSGRIARMSGDAPFTTLIVPTSCDGAAANLKCVCDRDCGTCSCSSGFNIISSGAWSTSGMMLTISPNVGPDVTLLYCVSGETLRLYDGLSLVIEMKRIYPAGIPKQCGERSATGCVGAGCNLGHCTGNSACELETSANLCTARSGCTWQQSQCTGNATSTCELGDYGVVDGCSLFDTVPRCEGTVVPCASRTDCTGECAPYVGCMGGATLDCRAIKLTGGTGGCSVCFDASCQCDQTGSCYGTTTCKSLRVQTDCGNAPGCSWTTGTCLGTTKPCSDRTYFECATAPGCDLAAVASQP